MHTVDTIMSEMVKLRVHIAPVGFEIDRVVIPAIKMKADKVYLLRHNDYSEDKSGPYLDKIVKKLEKVNIKTKTIGVNRYRLFGIIKTVKEIIQTERDNDVYLNIASGSKIHAVGCMMACMIFDDRTNIHPYYAQAKEYPQYKGNEQQTFGVEEIHKLPTYQIRHQAQSFCLHWHLLNRKAELQKRNLQKRQQT